MKGRIRTVTYFKIENNGLIEVSSPSEAQIARIDFYRKDLDIDLKLVSDNPGRASVSVLVSGSYTQGRQVVEASYKDLNIDREAFSTYPIKKIEDAYQELKSGNYWPAKDTSTNTVTIRRVYLAYFEPITLTNFLEPVFVFEGDGGFLAYVPAVVDKQIME